MMQYEKSDALGPLDEDDSDVEDEEENDDDENEYADEETEGDEESDGEYVASDDDDDDEGDEEYGTTHNFSALNDTANGTFQSSRNFTSFAEPSLNNLSLNNLNDSVAFVSEEPRPNTVETFCNTTVPTLAMFNGLEENDKVLAFKTFLNVN